jgi:hypothetical protein
MMTGMRKAWHRHGIPHHAVIAGIICGMLTAMIQMMNSMVFGVI